MVANDNSPPQRTAVIFTSSQVEMDAVMAYLEIGEPEATPAPFLIGYFQGWRVAVANVEGFKLEVAGTDSDGMLWVEPLRDGQLIRNGSMRRLEHDGTATYSGEYSYGPSSAHELMDIAWKVYAPEIALSVGAASAGSRIVRSGDVVIATVFNTDSGGNYGSNAWTWTDIKAISDSGNWRRRGGGPTAKIVLGNIAGAQRKAPKGGKGDKRFSDALAFDVPGTEFWQSPVPGRFPELMFIRGIVGRSEKSHIISAASAAAFAMEFLAHRSREPDPLEMLRNGLLDLTPADFERVVGAGLAGILDEPFRQASSGRQPGGDVGSDRVRVEAKRYRTKAPETRDLLGSLTSTLNAAPDITHWVVASTVGLSLQAVDDLHLAARRQNVKEVVLDWPDNGIPPLAAALVLGRDEVGKSFQAFGPILSRLSELPEVMAVGRRIFDLLRRDPPGRPIHDPVLRHVRNKVNPAAVLDPAYQVVKFMNRDQEMADWLDWAKNRNLPGRLLTGAGGMGKTRMLIEICEKLRNDGWRTGFLKEGAKFEDLYRQLLGREKWLIVVDYAERRPKDVDILCCAIRDSGATVRLALLARREGEWLEDMVVGTGAAADFLDNGQGLDRLELGPVAPARAAGRRNTRQAVFERAVTDYAEVGSRQTRPAYRAVDFGDPRYDNILLLLLEAWARAPGAQDFADAGAIPLEAVLKRETRYLRRCSPPGISSRSLMTVLCWIYEYGPAETYDDAVTLLARCPALSGQSADTVGRLAEVFHDVYPGPHWLNRIQPDLIGEEMVRRYGRWNP
jgi:hypothetical protein